MAGDAKWTVTMTPDLKAQLRHQIFLGVQEVYETQIKPEAQRLSPVSEEWPSIPEARGEPRIDTGANRRSIDTDVRETEEGVVAELFTQSGHGGYLEVGTSRMPARPYLYPAFQKYIKNLGAVIGAKIAAFRATKGGT